LARILYLVHRIPYPPNKGDKVRSHHLLKHLAERHEVLLGTFVDDPDDQQHVPALSQWCSEVLALPLSPLPARVASLTGLLRGTPLTLAYYRNAAMAAWVRRLRESGRIDAVVVFSSSMAPYAQGFDVPVLVDLVDVDSAKWAEYARARPWPLSWLYAREGRTLLAYEREIALTATRSFLVTQQEVALFERLAPDCAGRLQAIGNGVDADYFASDPGLASPFQAGEIPLVFTGAMDYWPNVDAVTWFAAEKLPALRARWPALRFHIVGRSPAPAVRALAGDHINVTGTVPDVRPYLQHAAVIVAPLRLARGVQNKVLEAMAMARPVVAASTCAAVLDAQAGVHLAAAETPAHYVNEVSRLLESEGEAVQMGRAARACVLQHYAWSARLGGLDPFLESSHPHAD
jgi:sugar transferase (PEP-CTERM/EpsH1 system associated)